MKREKIVFIIGLISILIGSIVSVSAVTYLYNANEVSYDNTNSGISATNVQGAINELYDTAQDYSSMNTRVSALEGYFRNNATSYFDGYGLNGISSIELNRTGALSNFGGFIDFHYGGSSSDYTSRIIESGSGVLNVAAPNGVLINGAEIKGFKMVDRVYNNVSINIKSAQGAYYVLQDAYSESGYTVASILCTGWSGASASFTPYYQSGYVGFASDVSQTISEIRVKLLLIAN